MAFCHKRTIFQNITLQTLFLCENETVMICSGCISTLLSCCHLEEEFHFPPVFALLLLRSESPSGKCAKLHTVAASSNRDDIP